MRAYFDESGDDPRDKIYVLAGWVAEQTVWEGFNAAWREALAANRISYFKHNEAKALKKQFAGRTPDDRDRIVAQLVDVACRHELIGIITSFKHPLYQLMLKDSTLPPAVLKTIGYGGYSSPYYFCFHLAVSQLLRYLLEVERRREPVEFVLDDRNDVLKPCIKLYDVIRGMISPDVRALAGTARPGDDKSEPPLQLADLLAGQVIANVRAAAPEPTLQRLADCRTILKCGIEPDDLSRFKATLDYANQRWKELGLDT